MLHAAAACSAEIPHPPEHRGRRALLAGLAGVAIDLLWPDTAIAHEDRDLSVAKALTAGRPARGKAVSALPLILASGLHADLITLTRDHATAVQLMFTGCGTTCLTQGALFEEVQQRLVARSMEARLLSISIDVLGDDAKTLTAWLRRFNAQPATWTAGVPTVAATERLLAEFRFGNGPAEVVEHLNRAFVFNRKGVLMWTTGVNPSSAEVTESIARYG